MSGFSRNRKRGGSRGRKDAEERAARGDPCKRSLEDLDAQAPVEQVANREGGQRAVGVEIGAQQDAGRLDSRLPQRIPQARRRKMDDGR
jgi:hypothetical protein